MKPAKLLCSVERTISILRLILFLLSTGSSALRPPFLNGAHGEEMTFGQRAFPISMLNAESSAPYGLYVPPPKDPEVTQESQESSSEKKQLLAHIMKARYQEFRRNLEQSMEQQPETFRGTGRQGASFDLPSTPNSPPRQFPYHLSPLQKPKRKQKASDEAAAALTSPDMNKRLRSPDEVHSPLRSAGIPPEAHPFDPLPTGARASLINSTDEEENNSEDVSDASSTHQVLEERLGPSARPSFDPSIVVDFSGLLQLTRQSQRLQKTRNVPPTRPSLSKLARRDRTSAVLIKSKSSPKGMKIVRRRLDNVPLHSIQNLPSRGQTKPKPVAKRAKYLQMPSNVGTNSTMKEDLSLYIATSPEPEDDESEKPEKESEESQFGPYSQGNDPTAGLPPSEVKVPNLDLSQVVLPQGVRDSLRKYLKPLISALKPLRKSVPGLPGLDYPILSVVPYTNFYCSNMPWPGFYADTEARCQTWHACDVDGRQATFLCPNGTVFNQALMVCDWWYNTDCLAAPFLYPLNERLFGTLQPEPVTLHTRITPELLDTIFV